MGHTDSLFESWATFYEIAGSAAAALTGLMFVVITLITGARRQAGSPEATATFSTPTVVHFGAALLVAVTLSAPWHGLIYPRILLGVASAYGVAYVVVNAIRIQRMPSYTADVEDWAWHTLMPALSYAAILLGALTLGKFPVQAPYAFATAVVAMIFTGIHNAWDIVTYVAIVQPANEATAADESKATETKTTP